MGGGIKMKLSDEERLKIKLAIAESNSLDEAKEKVDPYLRKEVKRYYRRKERIKKFWYPLYQSQLKKLKKK
jgi:hypothetical protein